MVASGAKPVYVLKPGWKKDNYEKSYALCRQVLYLSWLNGAVLHVGIGRFHPIEHGKGGFQDRKGQTDPLALGHVHGGERPS